MVADFLLRNSQSGVNCLAVLPASNRSLDLVVSKYERSLSRTLNMTSDSSKRNICTTFNNGTYCLDIELRDKNRTVPHLAPPSSAPGQQWSSYPITANGFDYQRLSTDWTGSGWYMGTKDSQWLAAMSQGDDASKFWEVPLPVDQIPETAPTSAIGPVNLMSAMSGSIGSSMSTSVIGSTDNSKGPTVSSTAAVETSAGSLDNTSKIAVGIGVGTGVPLVGLLRFVVFFGARLYKSVFKHDNNITGDEISPHEAIGEPSIGKRNTIGSLRTRAAPTVVTENVQPA